MRLNTVRKWEKIFPNVSFSLSKGEKMVLIGEDDIAKTRFFRMFAWIKTTNLRAVK